ncbi:monocarboxylate transporter 12-like [Uloborus diversus]|uniref:monocarboxylate transporter 12-like n=1 Tax=Uloborus diversus TaxID=327109 RepID=UPI00240A3F31|nr:monocarboxylate transporter 12-like [Uloborus diversus]
MDEEKSPEHPPEVSLPVVRPPDGGWGWFVVLGSFFCNVIVDGIIFSYGLFLPELAQDLGESKGRLAWVGSLLAGFYLIVGPVVSGLANTYGCRPVTICGAVLSSASFAVASFANSLELLCITFGVLGGIGFGFIYLPAVVTVGFYFERRRALATGLAVCGSGVGTFLIAPLVRFLLSQFGWRGTLLALSGLVLNCAAFGALFRPLVPVPLVEGESKLREIEPIVAQMSVSMPELSCSLGSKFSESPNTSEDNDSPPPSYSDVIGTDIFFAPPATSSLQKLPSLNQLKPSHSYKSVSFLRPMNPRFGDLSRPFYRQDILYSASLLNLPEFKKSQQNMAVYSASITKIPEQNEERSCLSLAMKDTFRQMLDTSLLRSPTFLLLAAGGFLTLAGFFIPFMFAIDRAVQRGISEEEATYLLPVIGLTNTVGRVFCGWISDRPSLNALSLNNAALIVGGLLTIISAYLNTVELLLTYGALFGFSIGCFATLRSIVIVDLLGLEKLTNAFGLLLLFQGIASIIGAPVAGMFYDATGSYDASFYISGSLILLSGILGLPLSKLSSWEKRRQAARCRQSYVVSSDCTEDAVSV